MIPCKTKLLPITITCAINVILGKVNMSQPPEIIISITITTMLNTVHSYITILSCPNLVLIYLNV